MLVVRRPGLPNLFHGSQDQSTVWRAPSPKMIMAGSTDEKLDHPAQKPVALFDAPIRNHLAPGEAVYDPFLAWANRAALRPLRRTQSRTGTRLVGLPRPTSTQT